MFHKFFFFVVALNSNTIIRSVNLTNNSNSINHSSIFACGTSSLLWQLFSCRHTCPHIHHLVLWRIFFSMLYNIFSSVPYSQRWLHNRLVEDRYVYMCPCNRGTCLLQHHLKIKNGIEFRTFCHSFSCLC